MQIKKDAKRIKQESAFAAIFFPFFKKIPEDEWDDIFNIFSSCYERVKSSIFKIKTTKTLDLKFIYSLLKKVLPEIYWSKLDEIYEELKEEPLPKKFIVYKTPHVTISPFVESNFTELTKFIDHGPDMSNPLSLYIAALSLISSNLRKTLLGEYSIKINEKSTWSQIFYDLSNYMFEERAISKRHKDLIDAWIDYAEKIDKRLNYS